MSDPARANEESGRNLKGSDIRIGFTRTEMLMSSPFRLDEFKDVHRGSPAPMKKSSRALRNLDYGASNQRTFGKASGASKTHVTLAETGVASFIDEFELLHEASMFMAVEAMHSAPNESAELTSVTAPQSLQGYESSLHEETDEALCALELMTDEAEEAEDQKRYEQLVDLCFKQGRLPDLMACATSSLSRGERAVQKLLSAAVLTMLILLAVLVAAFVCQPAPMNALPTAVAASCGGPLAAISRQLKPLALKLVKKAPKAKAAQSAPASPHALQFYRIPILMV